MKTLSESLISHFSEGKGDSAIKWLDSKSKKGSTVKLTKERDGIEGEIVTWSFDGQLPMRMHSDLRDFLKEKKISSRGDTYNWEDDNNKYAISFPGTINKTDRTVKTSYRRNNEPEMLNKLKKLQGK